MSTSERGPQEPGPTVVVGRAGRAHGIRGEVAVDVRTDDPDRRFAEGSVLEVAAARGATLPDGCPARLTVTKVRWHQGRALVSFAELPDRTAAERVRGALLTVTLAPDESPDDPEEFYDHQLEGLRVRTTDGVERGTVTEVVHGAAQDLLAIRLASGSEVLVPFVVDLVPTVDLEAGHLVVADRPGLLDPAAADVAASADDSAHE